MQVNLHRYRVVYKADAIFIKYRLQNKMHVAQLSYDVCF